MIRIVAAPSRSKIWENTVVKQGEPVSVTVRQWRTFATADHCRAGDGSVNSKPAVILTVQKQPGADTLTLDRKIEATLNAIQATLPADVKIEQRYLQASQLHHRGDQERRRSDSRPARYGSWWCCSCFCWNFRTSAITLTAIPLSIILTALVFHFFACRSTP